MDFTIKFGTYILKVGSFFHDSCLDELVDYEERTKSVDSWLIVVVFKQCINLLVGKYDH
jgi:hypothetical protein